MLLIGIVAVVALLLLRPTVPQTQVISVPLGHMAGWAACR
jgi:hypothetical protein